MRRKHRIETLFPLMLLFVFTMTAMSLTIIASGVYERSANSSARGDESRTAIAYVSEKIHHADESAAVSLGKLDSCEAVIIRQDDVITYLYFDESSLKEISASTELAVTRDMGTKICEIKDFNLEKLSDKLIRISCTDSSGHSSDTLIAIRSN